MAYTTGTLTGTHQDLAGNPHTGTVQVRPSVPELRDPDGHVILRGAISVDLTAGVYTVDLPASDDPTLDPSGFTYSVVVLADDQPAMVYTDVYVTAGQTLQEDTLGAPLDPAAPTYASLANDAETAAAAAATSATAAASSATAAAASATAAAADADRAESAVTLPTVADRTPVTQTTTTSPFTYTCPAGWVAQVTCTGGAGVSLTVNPEGGGGGTVFLGGTGSSVILTPGESVDVAWGATAPTIRARRLLSV